MQAKSLGFIALISLFVAACETTSTRPYEASVENVLAMQAARGDMEQKLSIGSAVAAADVDTELSCRALGALEVAPGQTPVDYIKTALQTEMFQAGLYDQTNGSVIDLTVTALDFSSFGTGNWTAALKLASPNLPDGYTVDVEYSFKTSWSAVKACQNVIDAFQPTVSTLIKKAVDDPRFKQL